MTNTLATVAAALPLATGWTIHSLWSRSRLIKAQRDPLTGLHRRGDFSRRAARLLDRGPCLVALVDLNEFKDVNDVYGHDGGDRVLIEAGHRLAGFGPGAYGRLGGDEFAAVAPVGHVDDAVDRARTVAHALAEPVAWGETTIPTGAAVGVVVDPAARGADLARLLRCADEAMYRAKDAPGRSGVVLRTDSSPILPSRLGRRPGRPGSGEGP